MTHDLYNVSEDFAANLFNSDYWRKLAPKMTVKGEFDDYTLSFSDEELEKLNQKLVNEGYIQIPTPGINSPMAEMRELFTKLVDMGVPPVFSFVYDELWTLRSQLKHIISKALHAEYAMLPDFWCWRVSPGQSGWAPHRDKNNGALFPDNTPKSVTVWIPITQAHPLNGCMYMLPANRDPQYGVNGAQGFQGKLPDVRALPGDPGDVYVWTQHVMHWGARSADEHDLGPRMSIAYEFQRSDLPAFNAPLLDPFALPSFEQRLALIAKQIMQYRHMYGFHEDLVNIAQDITKRLGKSLDDIGVKAA